MKVLQVLAAVCLLSCDRGVARQQTSDAEQCFSMEKIYYKPTNKCHKLLTRGPCPRGQWFVLEKPREFHRFRIEGKCVQENCPDGEFYWPETKSCVKSRDKERVCGGGEKQELRYNLFGEGECSCWRDPPHARLDNNPENPCHRLYTRGPCRINEILGFRDDGSEVPTCIYNRCYRASMQRKNSGDLSPEGILAPWGNNSCYELGTRGPCPEGMTFKIHASRLIPSCVQLTTSYFNISQDCFRDEKGMCQTEVVLNDDTFKWGIIKELKSIFRRRNIKRRSKAMRKD